MLDLEGEIAHGPHRIGGRRSHTFELRQSGELVAEASVAKLSAALSYLIALSEAGDADDGLRHQITSAKRRSMERK
jgi:hypothetical protein